MASYGPLGDLPSVSSIQNNINNAFDKLFLYSKSGKRHAFVCTFCDEYVISMHDRFFVSVSSIQKDRDRFEWKTYISDPAELARLQPLVDAYKFNDIDGHLTCHPWVNDLCLSPRGFIGKNGGRGAKYGFSSCSKCRNWISKKKLPFYAIVNRNFVGHAPECLTSLTEVELAFISPVKGYGYCFSWVGGAQKCLKGNLTFMRVTERKVVQAVSQLQGMGLTNHIVILLNGKMTETQKQRASKTIRVSKILTAVQWLCLNHKRWIGIDYFAYAREMENFVPTVVDHSKEVSSVNQNLESEELFSCYYPDGTVNPRQGGFNNVNDFKGFINELHAAGFNMELKTNLTKEFLNGSDGDQLISSCLLQFPYGIGGIEEHRELPNGTSTERAHLEGMMSHLSVVSQNCFQQPMFQLVLYSLVSKLKLLRRSRFQLRDERTVSALANGLDLNSLRSTIRGRQTGNRYAGSHASQSLLSAVDSMSRGLPHSNEAAKLARKQGQSMQHTFGTPSLFLTATFDDENSLLMQVMSGDLIDSNLNPSSMSDSELEALAVRRKDLRLNYPGLGALNFEMLLEVVSEHVIGWNMRDHVATESPGLFGYCLAMAAAMEEQGRKTVHVHFSIWIDGFTKLRSDLFFGERAEKRLAEKLIPEYSEHISSTSLIGSGSNRKTVLSKAFDHDKCSKALRDRNLPVVVNAQGLRNLRHRMGYKEDNRFAWCDACAQGFTYEDLVGLYCQRVGQIGQPIGLVTPESCGKIEMSKARLHATCVEFQGKKDAPATDVPSLSVNAAYNLHASSHVSGCFKCQKKRKRSHVCGTSRDCECRYRMPDRPRKKACIRDVNSSNLWFEWTGAERVQPIIEVLPKRHTYDLFQNVSCKAISESKLTCNSNVSIITDGPVGQYQFKYIMKSTQEDDCAAYSLVENSIKSMGSRLHDDDGKEACRRICRAAFAHNKGNIIGAGLASYLCRHDSRFYFSHSFQYCPLFDLKKALKNEKLPSTVVFGDGKEERYLENFSLHYLCRPTALESLSPREFFEEYEVRFFRAKSDDEMRFISDTGYFKHPSARITRNVIGKCRQGVKEREIPTNIMAIQWTFPDTAGFQRNILTCPFDDVNVSMEKYAESVLTMFHSYRSHDDFVPNTPAGNFPFVQKFREIYQYEVSAAIAGQPKRVFTDRNIEFLQNVQNCAYNSLRYKVENDDLQSVTACFRPQECGNDATDGNNSESDDEDDAIYEVFLDHCDTNDLNDNDPTAISQYLEDFNLKAIRNQGFHRSGANKHTPKVQPVRLNVPWVETVPVNLQQPTNAATPNNPQYEDPSLHVILRVLFRNRTVKARPKVFEYNPNALVCEATGSIESVIEWATAAKLDNLQKRAFECIIAAFILTFHEFEPSDYNDISLNDDDRTKARKVKAQLLFLKGSDDAQLIMLLHGMGGSGKTTVIVLVLCYAREFCDHLGHPFTIRTIVTTAFSGVAATLIFGETIHSAMGLMRRNLKQDMIDAWSDARLVIIDECSFASYALFNKIEQNARTLTGNKMKFYGGLNIVYAGDFSQLEPPRAEAVYNQPCPAFQDLLNCFIELDGEHRFSRDPEFGAINRRLRAGCPTLQDIRQMNETCTISPTHQPDHDVPVCVYRNKNRDAINSAMFEEYCIENEPDNSNDVFQGAVVVFMDNLEMRDIAKRYVSVASNAVKSYFYRNCGEDGCVLQDKKHARVDPILKLYPECPMMLVHNKDVPCGQANGTRVRLLKVQVRDGEQPMIISMSGTNIRAYFASQLLALQVRQENSDITPQTFDVAMKDFSFRAKISVDDQSRAVMMKGNQFPLISNSSTTGHKLQGCTLRQLAIFEHFYGQNWMYVVLSRVRTMNGLFFAVPLSEDLSKYSMPEKMKEMIAGFQARLGLHIYSDAEYQNQL